MPLMLSAPDAGGRPDGGLPSLSRMADALGLGHGSDPDCWFRWKSLKKMQGLTHPRLARVIHDVALPALHGRYVTVLDNAAGTGGESELAWEVAALLQRTGTDGARHRLHAAVEAGTPREDLLLHVLPQAAGALQARHADDRLSPLQLTLATCQLRTLAMEITREISRFEPRLDRLACLLSMPGDTLRFEPILHECFLQIAGWEIDKLEGLSTRAVVDHLRQHRPLLAVCVLNDVRLQGAFGEWIAGLRTTGRGTPRVFIGVGDGFADCDEAAMEAYGLDALSTDPRRSVRLAAMHFGGLRGRSC